MKVTRIFVLSTLIVLSSCSPQLGLRLPVPEIPASHAVSQGDPRGEPARVKIGSFIDSRPTPALAVIDGREVLSEGSLDVAVRDGFERDFREAGARVVIVNAPTIEGEIVEWRADVTPKFPASNAIAKARVKVTLRSAQGQILYRATYAGESSSTHPYLTESDVRYLLGTAMGSAIEEAVKDEGLVTQIATARQEYY